MPGPIKLLEGAGDPDPTDFVWPTMDSEPVGPSFPRVVPYAYLTGVNMAAAWKQDWSFSGKSFTAFPPPN